MAPLRIGVVAVVLFGAGLLALHELGSDGLTHAANNAGRDQSSGDGVLQLASVSVAMPSRVGSRGRSSRPAIAFALDRAGAVDIEIFDLRGRVVATPARREYLEAGAHRVTWRQDPDRPLEAGLYFVRLRTDTGLWRQTLIRVPGTRPGS